MTTGDVPPSPTIFDGTRMIDPLASFRKYGQSAGSYEHRSDEQSGHPVGLCRPVALQTAVGLSFYRRRFAFSLIERVKHGAKAWVGRSEFNHLPCMAVAHIDVVIEVQRARSARRDAIALHTRFRENEQLRSR